MSEGEAGRVVVSGARNRSIGAWAWRAASQLAVGAQLSPPFGAGSGDGDKLERQLGVQRSGGAQVNGCSTVSSAAMSGFGRKVSQNMGASSDVAVGHEALGQKVVSPLFTS
jgi:hypothetical protein